jgi:hypothetical protein
MARGVTRIYPEFDEISEPLTARSGRSRNLACYSAQRKVSIMRSPKQIAASRENGRKSHGAITPEGKARIVNANLWSGVFAETHVLTWEHQAELDEVREEYYACHPPSSPEARCLLDQIILCEWQLRRLANAESALWDEFGRTCSRDIEPAAEALRLGDQNFQRIQYRINSTLRAFQNALRELERLEARDRDVVVIPKDPDPPATETSDNHLQILGSLRKKDPEDPAAV